MMMLVCMMVYLLSGAFAMEGSFESGKSFSSISHDQSKGLATGFDATKVPGFETTTPPEASLHSGNIDEAITKRLSKNEAAQFIKESSQKRPQIKIEAATDPLFTASDKIASNPEEIMNLQSVRKDAVMDKKTYTCQKGQDVFEKKCRWTKVPVKTGTQSVEKTYVVSLHGLYVYDHDPDPYYLYGSYPPNGWFAPTDPRVLNAFRKMYPGKDQATGKSVPINLQKLKSVKITGFHGPYECLRGSLHGSRYNQFTVVSVEEKPTYELRDSRSDCEALEQMADRGNCGYKNKKCIEGASTKVIDGVPVYSACWVEEAIYECEGEKIDQCKHYLDKGCTQTNSVCKVFRDNICIKWEQTFSCQEKAGQSASYRLTGKDKSFCLDGDCVDGSYVANIEMLGALSQMTILRQAQNDLKEFNSVFKGKNLQCSRSCVSFKDCCGSGEGWGVSLGISQCNSEEKELVNQRKANRCVRVGTYCADRVAGICTRKKTSFCCFGSKLSRLLQENGRSQLKLNFGEAEEPNCRGFTPEELSQLDFSKMDLTELFEDVQKNFKPQPQEKITKSVSLDHLQQNMKNLSGSSK